MVTISKNDVVPFRTPSGKTRRHRSMPRMQRLDGAPAREPEIELLGRIAGRALWILRGVLWLAGAGAVGFGIWTMVAGEAPAPAAGSLPKGPALGFVWVCAGLPAMCPVDWLFGRGRWLALGAAALAWFVPSLLASDAEYGFVLRMFATLVPCLTLLVWRTLWSLTRRGARTVP
jgi:hypothetical protein